MEANLADLFELAVDTFGPREYVVAEGRVYSVHGIGALLDYGTYESGNLQLIVMSISAMVLFILIVNRFFWQPAYHLAQRRFALNY